MIQIFAVQEVVACERRNARLVSTFAFAPCTRRKRVCGGFGSFTIFVEKLVLVHI
jgi:hypothetical protein